MVHLKSEFNIADIVSKNWGYNKVWNLLLKPLFHTIGDTANLYVNDDPSMFNIIPAKDSYGDKMGNDKYISYK